MEKAKKMNKKGSLQDMLVIGVILLFFGIIVLIGFKITSEINDKIQASDVTEARGKAASATLTGLFPGVIDNSFLFLTIGLALGSLILASLVRVHPIFIPFFILGLIVLVFVSGILSNIYQEMAEETEFITQADQLTFTSKILNFLPFFVGIIGTLMMIILYKTWSNSQL